jgi:uncharacterized membrane protein
MGPILGPLCRWSNFSSRKSALDRIGAAVPSWARMSKGRLEAFSDGVIAILITIMVLELKVPHGNDWHALRLVVPTLLTYLLSFVFLGIYWNNHHHMLHMTTRINGKILWANLHLLFWLSLIPFGTAWIGESPSAPLPTAIYGVVLLLAGISYVILERTIIADQGKDSKLAAAIGKETKGKISATAYASAIPLAFVRPWISETLYVLVALMWLVPDRRIESKLKE